MSSHLPCSPTMIATCIDVLTFLAAYSGSIDQIAEECGTNVASVRRAINALRDVVPIEHVRYNEHGERVDFWKLNREIEPDEALVIALGLFLGDRHAERLRRRARVVL